MPEIRIATIDNRRLSYRRVGRGSRKILFFHGFPGSSAQIDPFQLHAGRLDLDVVCIDRPGYHQSERGEDRQFAQTTRAARELLRGLGWTSCEVVSVSGGTPFLFAFVQANPAFTSRVHIVSGLGPITTEGFGEIMSRKSRWLLKALPLLPTAVLSRVLSKGELRAAPTLAFVRTFLPASPTDLVALQDPSIQQMLSLSLKEAFAQHGQGPQHDAREYLSAWRVDLGNYKGPVDIWHGGQDRIIPTVMAERLAQTIPDARLHVLPEEGHYSLSMTRIDTILGSP